jgi:putative ABC transport system permease protein
MWNDLRHAARLFRKDRGVTIAAVVALAAGMSATITMFTIINGVYLRDLPFAHPDRIVSIGIRYVAGRAGGIDNLSFPDFKDLQASARRFDGIGAADEEAMDLSDETHAAERLTGAYVSANAFGLIGHQPALGRGFSVADDRVGAAPVVILGHTLWQRRYAANPAIVGQRIRVNGIVSTVVGIMPAGFGFPNQSALWRPLALRQDEERDRRDSRSIDAFGRLAEGVTLAQAEGDLAIVMARLARDFPETNAGIAPLVRPFRDLTTSGPIRIVFAGLMGAVIFLLLIACANVANLLLARGATRAGEMTLRVSLGATRRQIVRQLLAESLVLALIAGATGLALAAASVRLVQLSITGTGEPYWLRFPIEGGVFAFVAAVCLGTAVLCGLAPALHATRAGLAGGLSEAGRSAAGAVGARRWTDGFVVLQLALSLTMLAGAGLMIRNVVAFSRLDPGVDTQGLVSARVSLPAQRYRTVEERRVFYRRLAERLAALPGMRSGITSNAPTRGSIPRVLSINGRTPADERRSVATVAVGPGYLEALGVRPVRGRLFTNADEGTAGQLALVNERFAELHFPNAEAVGRSIQLLPAVPNAEPSAPLTIVGVVPNVRQTTPRGSNADPRNSEPVVYLAYAAAALPAATIMVRSDVDVAAVSSALREAVGALDADLPVTSVLRLDEAAAQELSILTVFSSMFSVFAAAALGLSMIGLYGVMAYSVTLRTRELGVRVALGARAGHVCWVITRRAAVQLAAGITLGLAGALGAGQLLQGMLFGVSSRDPLTFAGAPALMTVVALVACVVPARRAMRLDPVAALRAE